VRKIVHSSDENPSPRDGGCLKENIFERLSPPFFLERRNALRLARGFFERRSLQFSISK